MDSTNQLNWIFIWSLCQRFITGFNQSIGLYLNMDIHMVSMSKVSLWIQPISIGLCIPYEYSYGLYSLCQRLMTGFNQSIGLSLKWIHMVSVTKVSKMVHWMNWSVFPMLYEYLNQFHSVRFKFYTGYWPRLTLGGSRECITSG